MIARPAIKVKTSIPSNNLSVSTFNPPVTETLNPISTIGFNFVELSIDESDKRLARLDWSEEKIAQINAAIKKTGLIF